MAFLLVFKESQLEFSEDEAYSKLVTIGVLGLRRNPMVGASIAGHYDYCGDSVIVELKADLKTFAISDSGPAGLMFVMALQSHYDDGLRLIDESYSFDLSLREYFSFESLKDMVDNAGEK